MPDTLVSRLDSIGLDLPSEQLSRLETYADLLATSAHNLTSARDRDQVHSRHLMESLALGKLLSDRGLLPDAAGVLDLGAGGGLPGIPIVIAWPDIRLTLLESVAKKCSFLEDTAKVLRLPGVAVLEGRAETFGRDPDHRERYDLVLARAVAPLPVLLEYALPFLRTSGHLAAVKGSSAHREIEAAHAALGELSGHIVETLDLESPGQMPQVVVLVEKTGRMDDRFPRRAGLPSKRPL